MHSKIMNVAIAVAEPCSSVSFPEILAPPPHNRRIFDSVSLIVT